MSTKWKEKDKSIRGTKQYKIIYLAISLLLLGFLFYLHKTYYVDGIEINTIYFYIGLFVLLLANAIRRISFDVIVLLYLLFLIIYYYTIT